MPHKDPNERRKYRSHYAKRRKATDPAFAVRAKESDRKGASVFRAKRKALVDAMKAVPCMDCGGKFPPCCMDFDHRVGTMKIGPVARLAQAATLDVLLAEIAKCDLVCANCHRIRTHIGHPPE